LIDTVSLASLPKSTFPVKLAVVPVIPPDAKVPTVAVPVTPKSPPIVASSTTSKSSVDFKCSA